MKITREIKHHVNMGNFEWVELAASVEVDASSLSTVENDMEALRKTLNDSLRSELQQAASKTQDSGSYALEGWE